ncbi:MAG: YetF domain-containing protein, partial [Rubrivivax sp.]
LRISGKRTLSKWNAFDFVTTVALGSTLATVMLSKEVSLAQGVLAFAVLIGMQFLITWTSVRSAMVRRLVKSTPTLLLFRGSFVDRAMREQRVTESEVRAAIRSGGAAAIEDVYAVVLETDGSFSVLKDAPRGQPTALADTSWHEAAGSQQQAGRSADA